MFNRWDGPGQPTRVFTAAAKVTLDCLEAPPAYRGEWRCDLHPRLNRAATKIVVDSPHEGHGRQMYLVELAGVIGR